MADFKKFGGRDKGRKDFGGGRPPFRGGDDRGERQLFKATCANCGRTAEVPFRPTGERPVYCKDCFAEMKGGGNPAPGRPQAQVYSPGADKPRSDEIMAQLKILNSKIDKLIGLHGPSQAAESNPEPMPVVPLSKLEPKGDKKPAPAKKKVSKKK